MKEATTFLDVNPNTSRTFVYPKDVLSYAAQYGFIKQGGAWFTAVDGKGEVLHKTQGGDKMANYIETHPAFYIKLKILIYSKLYQPFEFYYHFDLLKGMLFKEFEYIQEDLKRQLSFTDGLTADDKEEIEKQINETTDLLDLKITDILTETNIKKAIFELEKFYDKEELAKLATVNN